MDEEQGGCHGILEHAKHCVKRFSKELIKQQYASSGLARQLTCLVVFLMAVILALVAALVVAHVTKNKEMGNNEKDDVELRVEMATGSQSSMKFREVVEVGGITTGNNSSEFSMKHWSSCSVHATSPDQIYDPKPLGSECEKVAAQVLPQMNRNVSACQDFYEFSCGSWDTINFPPPARPKWTSFSKVDKKNTGRLNKILSRGNIQYKGKNSTAMQKVDDYYRACMDAGSQKESNTNQLKQMLLKLGVGNLPIDGAPAWDSESWNLSSPLMYLNSLNLDPLINYKVGPDDKDSHVARIKLTQRGLTLRLEKSYNCSGDCALKEAFLAFSRAALGLLGASDVNTQTEELWEFEKELASIYVPREILRKPELSYNLKKVQWMNDLMKPVGLDIQEMLTKKYNKDIPLDEETVVVTPSYMNKLPAILAKYQAPEKRHVLANYLAWVLIDSFGPFVSDDFRQASLLLQKVEVGIQSLTSRWELCIAHTKNAVGMALGARFVELYFPEHEKKLIEDILAHVREAYANYFPTLAWMDKATQNEAIKKVKAIAQKLGYPDWLLDPVKLDHYYEQLQTTADSQLANALASHKFALIRQGNKIGKVPDRTIWQMMPSEVNAYYEPSFNEIVFPAGILQNPFFDSTLPMPLTFGAVGSVMGHEVSHGFDDTGSKYDKDGNMKTWWTAASTKRFNNRTECMAEQYSAYHLPGDKTAKVNGKLTLGENIADNGGVKIGLIAYHAWAKKNTQHPGCPTLGLSEKQLFFLGYSQIWCSYYQPAYARQSLETDVHSPNRFRVIGVMSNSEAFSDAFNCPKGSHMNPEHKCQVW